MGARGGQAENLFHDPARRPTARERRLMVAVFLEIMIKKVMGKHTYSFNGTNRLQLEGGPVGLKLSGALAKVCMLVWCRKFMATIKRPSRGPQRTPGVLYCTVLYCIVLYCTVLYCTVVRRSVVRRSVV